MNWGVELLQSSALPLGYGTLFKDGAKRSLLHLTGASDEARTRYLHLGKVALYQMSYARICAIGIQLRSWCLRSESNQRHADFQSAALPTELQRHMATKKGLEPSTSSVTGWRSNQLNYLAKSDLSHLHSITHLQANVKSFFGRGRRIRTLDTRFWRPLLYQLSYTPISRQIILSPIRGH